MTTSQKKLPYALSALIMAFTLTLWSLSALAGFCSVSTSGLVFGAYQPVTFAGKLQSSDVSSNATISVACGGISSGAGYTIGLGRSVQGPGNGISTRYLYNTSKPGDLMAYNIYTNPNRTAVWGSNTNLLSGAIAPGNSNFSHTVYGLIPEGQYTMTSGSYVDTLAITLTYVP